ncbi:Protein kinase alk2 [Kappamyces sp. JEL0680]|nr:Protein kinase alk2 [Kappamyces sp. JEL0680]
MHDLFYRFFMDSFGKIAFGADLQSLTYKELPFVSAFDRAQLQISEMMMNPLLWLQNKFAGQYSRDVKTIRSFGLDLVQKRKEQSETGTKDLLSLFMAFKKDDGSSLTDDELVDQVVNFIIAGRDTTAQALSWTLYDLATHPQVVEKLVKEARAVMGEETIPSYDQVREMKYAKAVFNESLRLHPSVRRDGKEAIDDDVLPNGLKIKKGTQLSWNNYAMGHSERIWENASKYDPERWLGGKTYSQYEYPVFNCGPRICLGKTLAELQGVFVLVCILVQFNIDPIDLTGVDYLFSLTNPMKGSGLLSAISPR